MSRRVDRLLRAYTETPMLFNVFSTADTYVQYGSSNGITLVMCFALLL